MEGYVACYKCDCLVHGNKATIDNSHKTAEIKNNFTLGTSSIDETPVDSSLTTLSEE